MKNKFTLSLLLVLFAGCSKHDSPSPIPPIQPLSPLSIIDRSDPLRFKIIPLSANQLKISFQYSPGRELINLFLKKDTVVVGSYALNKEPNSYYSTILTYAFEAGQKYSLVVESSGVNDTAYRYTLPDYTHIYTGPYTYQKLLALTQSLGPRAFDISPSRNFIFITDDIHNNLVTKRLSLKDFTIDTVGGNIHGLMIRAMSDDEILIEGNYGSRPPGIDSAALLRYNIKTRQSSFIDYVSPDYGRFSRVINNHILVTNPVFTSATSSLIDLKDNSKVTYPYSIINFSLVGENNFDHIYYENQVVDPATGSLETKLNLTDSSGIEYIDSATQFAITSKYVLYNPNDPLNYYKSQLSVYLQNNLVYRGDYANTRLFRIGRQFRINNKRILFYQSFGYDTSYRVDGYYLLDLNTKQVSLTQCDSNPYVIDDFQLDDHTVISVRSNGVYKITLP